MKIDVIKIQKSLMIFVASAAVVIVAQNITQAFFI
jgi:hypothetical protein